LVVVERYCAPLRINDRFPRDTGDNNRGFRISLHSTRCEQAKPEQIEIYVPARVEGEGVLSAVLPQIESKRLRRIALQQQGLLQRATFGRGRAAVMRALSRLGYIQIDTISVVERAHHHVLRSRVPNFEPRYLQRLLADGEAFEYWSHAAAFLPMQHYRFSLVRKEAFRNGEAHWGRNRDDKLMAEILQRIDHEGALKSRDFEHAPGTGGWWEWKPAKQALEQLFMQGDLMVAARTGFQKTYDLPERVLPAAVDTSLPSSAEYAAHLIDGSLLAQGFVSAVSVSYLRKGALLRKAIKAELEARADRGELLAVQLATGGVYYGEPELLDSAPARVARRISILSPFDNLLIQRERTRQLFAFDYQIECYVPAHKRVYGYFCLPLLYGDTFIGRMDCKVHRDVRHFEIRSLYLEKSVLPDAALVSALEKAIVEFADYNGCDSIELGHCIQRKFANDLRRVLN
jgi:uncharacterized protein YcaQ